MRALPVAGWFGNTRGLGIDLTVAVRRSSDRSQDDGTGAWSLTPSPPGGRAEVLATSSSAKVPFYVARPWWPSEQTFTDIPRTSSAGARRAVPRPPAGRPRRSSVGGYQAGRATGSRDGPQQAGPRHLRWRAADLGCGRSAAGQDRA